MHVHSDQHAPMATDPHQEAARDYVNRVCAQMNWDYSTLARKSGLSASTITRFMNNVNVKHSLSARSLAKIASVTGVRLPDSLGGASDTTRLNPQDGVQLAVERVQPPGARDLPVLGQAMGGEEDLFFETGVVQAYVERPWFLMGNGNAYAVYVNGTSMEPAYRHGELCYVDPSRPPRPGQDVVVQLQDGRGFVKTLQRRTASAIEVLQYNPERRLTFAAEEVQFVHLIVAALKITS